MLPARWTSIIWPPPFISYIYLIKSMYLPNPSFMVKMWYIQFCKGSTADLNLEFSFSSTGVHSKVKEASCPLAERRIVQFLISPRASNKQNDFCCLFLYLFSYTQNIHTGVHHYFWWCPHGVMVKAMGGGIVVSEFVLQSCYYVHFWANTLGKGINLLTLPTMG